MSDANLTPGSTTTQPMFKVMLLNDDETPMEFVTLVLEEVFGRTQEEATENHDGYAL